MPGYILSGEYFTVIFCTLLQLVKRILYINYLHLICKMFASPHTLFSDEDILSRPEDPSSPGGLKNYTNRKWGLGLVSNTNGTKKVILCTLAKEEFKGLHFINNRGTKF
jgi:hypothetical protein